MQVVIWVNKNKIIARKGETILMTLKRNGIKIPTLCNLPELTPTGACRLCVVENEDTKKLIPACSTPVYEGMKILTHSQKVIKSRQTIVELLLTNHPDDCLYCDKNRSCELQALAEELYIRERIFSGTKKSGKTDRSSQGIVYNMSKCILCERCVKLCSDIVGVSALNNTYRGKHSSVDTVLSKGLYYSSCIQCGQCINVCPTGALSEKSAIEQIASKINHKSTSISIILSASSVASIAAEYEIRKFNDMSGMLVAALKDIGFTSVIVDNFGSDMYFSDLTSMILERIEIPEQKTIITDCPSVIQWIKQKYPQYGNLISPIRSPQQISARLLKKDLNKYKLTVAVMPCIARKTEALETYNLTRGLPDVDFVVTTNELLYLMRTRGIHIPFPKSSNIDKPYNVFSSCSVLHEFNGGYSEAIIRNYQSIKNKKIIEDNIPELRQNKPIKIYDTKLNNKNIKFAILNGMLAINNYFEKIINDSTINIIEMSACYGGCVNGSSQLNKNSQIPEKILQDFENTERLRNSIQNPIVKGFVSENILQPSTRYNNK